VVHLSQGCALSRSAVSSCAFILLFLVFASSLDAGTSEGLAGRPSRAGIAEDFTSYMDYDRMAEHLESIVKAHSGIASLSSIGKTYEGRDLWCVKVSDRPSEEDDGGEEYEPNVLLVGAHHGNEWISYEVPLYVLSFLLENYGGSDYNGSMATNIVEGRETYIIPMLNADGVQYSFDSGSGFRKNREPNYLSDFSPTGGDGPQIRPTSYGVDINRNYGWMWHLAQGSNALNQGGSSYRGAPDNSDDDGDATVPIDWRPGYTEPGPEDGVDEDPWDGIDNDGDGEVDEDPSGGFTAAEAQALRALGDEVSFEALITYHSFSELVLWPWGYTSDPCPDDDLFETLGVRLAEMNGYEPMQGYDLYMTSGEMTDWFYAAYGTLAYTFEIGQTYAPPEEEIVDECARNIESSMYLCHAAENPYESYVRFDQNSSEFIVDGGSVRVRIDFSDSGYPIPWDIGSFEVVYRDRSGKDSSCRLSEDADGVWVADIPRGDVGGKMEYYFRLVDSEGGEVTYPTYAPQMRLAALVPVEGSIFGPIGITVLGLAALALAVAGSIMVAMRLRRSRGSKANTKGRTG
jgi:carboxypeptidase T